MDYDVFIPYSNTKVWKPLPTGVEGILARIRAKSDNRAVRRELQESFEEWAVENMTYDWGLDNREDGMAFQFEQHQQAVCFKLIWA